MDPSVWWEVAWPVDMAGMAIAYEEVKTVKRSRSFRNEQRLEGGITEV